MEEIVCNQPTNLPTTIDVSTTNILLDDSILELYKHIVDFCKSNNIKDYETKRPLIYYINRDAFIDYIKKELSSS